MFPVSNHLNYDTLGFMVQPGTAMTVRNRAWRANPWPVPLPLTLVSAFAYPWKVTSWLATFFYNVTVAPLLRWYVTPQADLSSVIRERRSMPDDPNILDNYQAGYEATASFVESHSLQEIYAALRSLLPKAQREFDWGAVDALTDAVEERGKNASP